MELVNALEQISSGKTLPVYLLCGDEPLLAEDLLSSLKQAIVRDPSMESLLYFRYDAATDDAQQALFEMRSGAFFGGKKLCVVRGLTFGAKKEAGAWEAALVDYLTSYNPDTVLAVLSTSEPPAKNRVKLLAEEIGSVIRCARLKGREVGRWAIAQIEAMGKRASPSAAWALESLSGPSLGVLRSEIDKLVTYVGGRKVIEASDIAQVCADASEVRIFAVLDAITEGKPGEAASALEKLLVSGQPAIVTLYSIAQNMRQICRAFHLRRNGVQSADAARVMGVHSFVASKAYQASTKLQEDDLVRLYELVLAADHACKSGSDALLTLQTLAVELGSIFAFRRKPVSTRYA